MTTQITAAEKTSWMSTDAASTKEKFVSKNVATVVRITTLPGEQSPQEQGKPYFGNVHGPYINRFVRYELWVNVQVAIFFSLLLRMFAVRVVFWNICKLQSVIPSVQ